MNTKELLTALAGNEAEPDFRKVINELKSQSKTDSSVLEAATHELDPLKHKVMDTRFRPDKWVKVDPSDPNKCELVNITDPTEETTKNLTREKVARVAIALQKLIRNRAVSFASGNPVNLKAEAADEKEKAVLKAVKRVLYDIKEKSHNRRVCRTLFGTTEVAELWYAVENKNNTYGFDSKFKLRCAIFDSTHDKLYPYFDETGDMIAFSREFVKKVAEKDVTFFETYTSEKHFLWNLSVNGFELLEGYPKDLAIKKIPVVYGKQAQVEWADVQNLIDRLEKLLSNFADTNDYHASPKIVVKGELTGFAKKGEAGAILQLEGEDASANYLSWQSAPESVKLEIETLLKMIYTITQTPDISFDSVKGLGAISGIALQLLFMDAHLKVEDHREVLDEYMQRRVNIIKAFVGKFNTNLEEAADNLQVEPEIVPYMLNDELAQIQKWTTANGNKPLISQKLSAELAGLSQDPEADFLQMQEENRQANSFSFNEPTDV